jgi:IS30 family transposase
MLSEGWSPEIIRAQLQQRYPDEAAMQISHECLYQWIYRQIAANKRGPDCLWYPRQARRGRYSRRPQHSRIPGRVDIEERPEVVAERSRVGDWEGDSVVSAKNRGGISTFVERKTRFVIAGHLADKQASTFAAAAQEIFSWVPESLCHTATLDNGTEMAAHALFSQPKSMAIYFAHPHAPWQRGANEQVNGMIRRYFPKGTDFSKVTSAELDAVILKINKRPRKCLNYRAPYDVFADALRGALAV